MQFYGGFGAAIARKAVGREKGNTVHRPAGIDPEVLIAIPSCILYGIQQPLLYNLYQRWVSLNLLPGHIPECCQ